MHLINATIGISHWIQDEALITLQGEDALSGISMIMYKIDDGDWEEYDEPFTFGVKGIHIIYYYSVDVAGNVESSHNFTIKIDDDDPTVTLTAPEEGRIHIFNRAILPTIFGNTIVIGRFKATAAADDATSDIDKVEFYIDNELRFPDYAEPYEYYLERNILAQHTITLIAYDYAGHTTESEDLTYISMLNYRRQ
jgi:hypothetical protein